MAGSIHHRLSALERRNRRVPHRQSKHERDAIVAHALANPDWFHEIGVALLGDERPGDREHHAAILAAWRADT